MTFHTFSPLSPLSEVVSCQSSSYGQSYETEGEDDSQPAQEPALLFSLRLLDEDIVALAFVFKCRNATLQKVQKREMNEIYYYIIIWAKTIQTTECFNRFILVLFLHSYGSGFCIVLNHQFGKRKILFYLLAEVFRPFSNINFAIHNIIN